MKIWAYSYMGNIGIYLYQYTWLTWHHSLTSNLLCYAKTAMQLVCIVILFLTPDKNEAVLFYGCQKRTDNCPWKVHILNIVSKVYILHGGKVLFLMLLRLFRYLHWSTVYCSVFVLELHPQKRHSQISKQSSARTEGSRFRARPPKGPVFQMFGK